MAPETGVDGGEQKQQPLYKNPFLIAFVVGAVILTILPVMQAMTYRAPPPVSSLGDWSLLDQDGQPVTDESLKGQVWIASFFFSRCPSVCPRQQADFEKILAHVDDLKDDTKKPIRLVSISVDPEYDTPAVLKEYAAKRGRPKDEWMFVTGDKPAITELLTKRMFIDVGEKVPLPGNPDVFDIAHAERFVLIDQNGDVRGFWPVDEMGRGNLINAARLIWKRGPNP